MNTKGIVAIKDKDICMKCLCKKPTHFYAVTGRGYGSVFDNVDTIFQCCDDCDEPVYKNWFYEIPNIGEFTEYYTYEDKISELIASLPLESQELFFNSFDTHSYLLDSQDWIDFHLDELSHEKCRKYGICSPKDIESYNTKFPKCEYVVNVIWDDNSKGSVCPFNIHGLYDQKPYKDGNIPQECTDCFYFKVRENAIKSIKGQDLNDWKIYMRAKIKEEEYKRKFEN